MRQGQQQIVMPVGRPVRVQRQAAVDGLLHMVQPESRQARPGVRVHPVTVTYEPRPPDPKRLAPGEDVVADTIGDGPPRVQERAVASMLRAARQTNPPRADDEAGEDAPGALAAMMRAARQTNARADDSS